MGMIIREERGSETRKVFDLIKLAFKNENAAYLADVLRKRSEFISGLSLIAELNGFLAGHVLFSKINIQTEDRLLNTLWLEPLSVHPAYQKQGIGTALVLEGLAIGQAMGFRSVFVLGSPKYYCRFGFRPAKHYGIESSIYIPAESFLAMELKENELIGKKGKIIYPEEIFE